MRIKNPDPKDKALAQLDALISQAEGRTAKSLEGEKLKLLAGIKAENEARYLIDFDLAQSQNWAVIHDLRLEHAGRVAQIDHLLINRMMGFCVLETKHFNSGLKIEDNGEFLRWNNYRKSYDGMPSPIAQNERHIAVLRDVLNDIDLPTRAGLRLSPTFHSYILVSASARIIRPKTPVAQNVIKTEDLIKTLLAQEPEGVFATFKAVANIISSETLHNLASALVALHKPIEIDYRAKFGIADDAATVAPEASPRTDTATTATPITTAVSGAPITGSALECRHCGSPALNVQYGKFGYYLKCAKCAGNTPIKITCGQAGHKEVIRKEGSNFYRECKACGTSSLYHSNRE